jgi:alpha,alpha-trehalase
MANIRIDRSPEGLLKELVIMASKMLEKAKTITDKLRGLNFMGSHHDLTPQEVQPALEYIQNYWQRLERFHPKDDENLVGLPKPFLVPSFEDGHEFDYNELYYWDSYFMVQGLMDEAHRELVLGILEDLVYLFNRFKVIPNASRLYLTSRSQPPFLTTFIWDVYEAYHMDQAWLGGMMKVAEAEYRTVWMGTRKPHARQVYKGMSRYYDFNYLNEIAEAESGWDMTPRFGRKALDYVPVDLNALLYKYEMDFTRYYRLIGDKRTAAKWEVTAKYRRETIDGLMWNSLRGLYYDFNYKKEKRGTVNSLAAYYPMWAGMVDEEQAAQLVKSLHRFENRGGLATTDTQSLGQYMPGISMVPTQWAYPNGWAPLHFLVVKGLQRYGYHEDARRIAIKWLRTNMDWFTKNGVFLEKYNVVQPDKPPVKGLYPSQTGFGWTNAVFIRFCKEFVRPQE